MRATSFTIGAHRCPSRPGGPRDHTGGASEMITKERREAARNDSTYSVMLVDGRFIMAQLIGPRVPERYVYALPCPADEIVAVGMTTTGADEPRFTITSNCGRFVLEENHWRHYC